MALYVKDYMLYTVMDFLTWGFRTIRLMDPNVAFVAWRALFIIMRKQDGQLQKQEANSRRWKRNTSR